MNNLTAALKCRLSFAMLLCLPVSAFCGKLELEVFNVGQGNCVLMKATSTNQSPKHMLVDIGSSAYKKELVFRERLSTLSDSSSPMIDSGSESVESGFPPSEIKSLNPR
ncbi:MAG: hypothetical protein ACRCUQ_02915 [Alphaproteobacteria bacterium]